MPIYKIVFSNDGISMLETAEEPHVYSYRIEAASSDEALGLAELEFKQKHPQQSNKRYRARVEAVNVDSAQGIHQFYGTAPLNPDQ